MQGAELLHDLLAILVGAGLQVRALRMIVADVDELVRAQAADLLGGLVAAVAGGESLRARSVIRREDILALHPRRHAEAGGGEREGGEVDVFDEVRTDLADGDAGTADDERDMRTFFIKELLAAGVADAVVGHEDDQSVRQLAFLFEPGEHAADVQVGQADGVEVIGPVLQQHRVARVVGRQGDLAGVGDGAQFTDDMFTKFHSGGFRAFTQFATVQLDLHEERLPGLAAGPVMRVVDGRIPLEVVVRLAEAAARAGLGLLALAGVEGQATEVEVGQAAADAGIVAALLEELRRGCDLGG